MEKVMKVYFHIKNHIRKVVKDIELKRKRTKVLKKKPKKKKFQINGELRIMESKLKRLLVKLLVMKKKQKHQANQKEKKKQQISHLKAQTVNRLTKLIVMMIVMRWEKAAVMKAMQALMTDQVTKTMVIALLVTVMTKQSQLQVEITKVVPQLKPTEKNKEKMQVMMNTKSQQSKKQAPNNHLVQPQTITHHLPMIKNQVISQLDQPQPLMKDHQHQKLINLQKTNTILRKHQRMDQRRMSQKRMIRRKNQKKMISHQLKH